MVKIAYFNRVSCSSEVDCPVAKPFLFFHYRPSVILYPLFGESVNLRGALLTPRVCPRAR